MKTLLRTAVLSLIVFAGITAFSSANSTLPGAVGPQKPQCSCFPPSR
jgi:hypothetical protein